ncbi:hypothetical protein HGI30_08095 [Paenibacillus albicereus]|uniref:SGNH hydrolase-type esterase domain-containing protein n=1 Tax=Paenibacillus albicereus TaxID=2726185 RepID=A0A6H2GVR2_9BACL|nr:GDSL-type esterase/lipase family protein [Paenibacillus albicereus]QJC51513.1 hypothetical protein HGI30_08095 [Paenibacillus albicereus]
MIDKGIYFHNVVEMVPVAEGLQLCRIPTELRLSLNGIAQDSGQKTGAVELRFHLKSDRIRLKFAVLNPEQLTGGHAVAEVLHGTFPETAPRFLGRHETEIVVERPAELAALTELAAKSQAAFPPDLVRILLPYETRIALVEVDGEAEPPRAGSMPSRTLLAYGSSITSGASAVRPSGQYAGRTAERLGADLRSVSCAGGAMAEPEMAAYIAAQPWDAAFIELGINLIWDVPRGVPGSPEAFRGKVDAFLSILAEKRPHDWIFVTDLFAYKGDLSGDPLGAAFRDIVADKVRRLGRPNVVHLPGLQLLPDPALLAFDLIHPSEDGHAVLADRLAGSIGKQWSGLQPAAAPSRIEEER